ncbi:MAG TPA: SHOCT domain-containing protein, partial [Solirubrobacterales bacterium]|nr:SHOCT domain-containing protein [Solirubrobacterales bacterium]
LSAPTQNLRSFLTTLIIAGLAAFGINELRKQTQAEYPDADFGEHLGRAKERVVGAVKGANLGERASKLRLPEMRRPASEDAEENRLARLERLADLHQKGILTDEELAAEKTRILSAAQ